MVELDKAVVKAYCWGRSSSDSGTASGALGEGTSVTLFSFSSSGRPLAITAPGTLSAILADAWMPAFSDCGSRVIDDLNGRRTMP